MTDQDPNSEPAKRRTEQATLRRREFLERLLAASGTLASTAVASSFQGDDSSSRRKNWRIGHHFWNWDHAWNKGEFLDQRLRLTKETGYEGFEAKPEQIGRPAEEVRQKCAALGIHCAAIGGGLEDGIEYAQAAGSKIVRTHVPKEET
ncbi:hypothetical protein FJY63_12960, partial [Candidatus Sumerlaeota bacterium]|nr:hypothetical protein [Candidatus Sumerlaeota bacterium]